ncbi:MAG: DUF481 domain-containing protein [Bacteroidota bacterium]
MTTSIKAQTDSLSVKVALGMRGKWQTGNSNQFAINPSLLVLLGNQKASTELSLSYHYLKVEEFRILNEFWTGATTGFMSSKRIFPLVAVHYGFADSYKINRMFLAGAGGGMNITKPKANLKAQLYAYGGYINMVFDEEVRHSGPALGASLRFETNTARRAQFKLKLMSYNSMKDTSFWGLNNEVTIAWRVVKGLFVTLSHSTIFNNISAESIKKTNTLMLFGLQYQFFNHNNSKS